MTAGQQVIAAGVLGLAAGLAVLHLSEWLAARRRRSRRIPSYPWSKNR